MGNNHWEKRGCTILYEKDYSGVVTSVAVTSDQEFDCFSLLLVGGEGYLYKLRDDVKVASISGGYNNMIFIVVTAFEL